MDEDTESASAFHEPILDAVDDGFDGIELNSATPDLFNLVSFVRIGPRRRSVDRARAWGAWCAPARTSTRWS